MGIRSEEAIALGRIADKLQSLDNTMQKIEKDLHSIDISLGAMKPESINDIRQKYGFEIVPKRDVLGRDDGYIITRNEYGEPVISKSPRQIIDEAMLNKYGNKEDNNETRN